MLYDKSGSTRPALKHIHDDYFGKLVPCYPPTSWDWPISMLERAQALDIVQKIEAEALRRAVGKYEHGIREWDDGGSPSAHLIGILNMNNTP